MTDFLIVITFPKIKSVLNSQNGFCFSLISSFVSKILKDGVGKKKNEVGKIVGKTLF